MPPAGFEPTISAGKRSRTYALDRAATGIGKFIYILFENVTKSTVKIVRLNQF